MNTSRIESDLGLIFSKDPKVRLFQRESAQGQEKARLESVLVLVLFFCCCQAAFLKKWRDLLIELQKQTNAKKALQIIFKFEPLVYYWLTR
jgi:hypothetical protein